MRADEQMTHTEMELSRLKRIINKAKIRLDQGEYAEGNLLLLADFLEDQATEINKEVDARE